MTTKSARTRQRILDAAATVFSERGYAGTRLADIAEVAGTKAGSLYYHFASKEELVEELLRAGVTAAFDYVRDAVEKLGPAARPGERLRAAIAAHAEAVIRIGAYTAANARIVGQVPADMRRRHYREQRKYGDFWQALFQAAVDAGEIRDDVDPVVVRFLIIGALNWTVEWPPQLRHSSTIAHTLNAVLFDGGLTVPNGP
ncbi:MAG: TetR/AcrR family transcriptional regulator [Acidimicrobiales bacterium]